MSQYTKGSVLTGRSCDITPGTGNYHFELAGCDDCDVRHLLAQTRGDVEELYRTGRIRLAMFEAYMHAWYTSVPRLGGTAGHWARPPVDVETAGLVTLMRKTTVAR